MAIHNIKASELMDKTLKITDLADKHNVDDIGVLAAELYQDIGLYVHNIYNAVEQLKTEITMGSQDDK